MEGGQSCNMGILPLFIPSFAPLCVHIGDFRLLLFFLILAAFAVGEEVALYKTRDTNLIRGFWNCDGLCRAPGTNAHDESIM